MLRLTASAALIALLPAMSSAQGRVSWFDLITPERIVQSALQTGIMMLRTQMDLKYGDMSVNLTTGRVTLTDVKMWPLPEWDENGDCEVSIRRLTLRSGAIDQLDRLRIKAQVSGASAPASCLPLDARQGLAMAGVDGLEMPRMTIDVDYGIPGSDATARMFGVIENVAAVDLTAKFAYVWVDGRDDMEDPNPVVFLSNAALTVENRGVWEAVKAQLPPPMTDPASAGPFVEGALSGVLADMNRGGDSSAGPSASQSAFLASVVSAWPAFLAAPQRLVLETGFSGDTFLDFEAMEDDPRAAFDTLMPRLSLAPAHVSDMLPVALIAQAMGSEAASLPEADRRTAGIAMVTGTGAPRNLDAGIELLMPLARAGDGTAALVLSEALETRAPEDAYRWALAAGRSGEAGATARLDRLEGQIDFARVLELQNDVSGKDKHSQDALQSVALVRDQAAMRLTGRGQARSYGIAAMWASLAKAAGDPEASDILADVDEHVRLSGPEAQAAWRAAETRASALAMEVWIGQDLPARFAR